MYLMRAVSLERHCSGVELSSGGRDMSSDTPDSSCMREKEGGGGGGEGKREGGRDGGRERRRGSEITCYGPILQWQSLQCPHIAVGLHVFKKLLEQLDREHHFLHPEISEGHEGGGDIGDQ